MRSKTRWFTEFCNSHYVSQFAAFFIDAQAKRSTVKSCIYCFSFFMLFNLVVIKCGCWHVRDRRWYHHHTILPTKDFLKSTWYEYYTHPSSHKWQKPSTTTQVVVQNYWWSIRRFTYGYLVTTFTSSKQTSLIRFTTSRLTCARQNITPETSLPNSIGSSDGRCVQRTGT